jgi:hypothetical protein
VAGRSSGMELRLASGAMALPVRFGDIVLGHVVDVILDSRLERALGFEVRCGDEEHRFLPLAAATLAADEVVARSPLALLDEPELSFYAERGASLRALRAGGEVVDVDLGPGRVVSG